MDSKNCNNIIDNEFSTDLDVLENPNNDGGNNDFVKMLDCVKSDKNDKMSELDEFDQVLSEYRDQQHTITQKCKNTTNEYDATQTIINLCLDITENGIYCEEISENVIKIETTENVVNTEGTTKNITDSEAMREKQHFNQDVPHPEKMNINENCTINNIENKFIEVFQYVNVTAIDVISISSDESRNFNKSDDIIDLDAISLCSYNSIMFEKSNENKSMEIEIDFKNFTEVNNNEALDNDLGTATKNNDIVKNFENFHRESNIAIGNDIGTALESNDGEMLESESNSSYHSSDFEFITEDEAKIDGLIVNFRGNNIKDGNDNVNNEHYVEICLPGPSNEYHRENYRIPEGEEFFNLFHGFFAPVNVPELMFLENKSVMPAKCMSVDDKVVGFHVPVLLKDVVGEEYQEEANETAKKIRESYQDERRRSRRHL